MTAKRQRPARRRPTIRVQSDTLKGYEVDGWRLADWTKKYQEFADESGIPIESVQMSVESDYDNGVEVYLYGFREQTQAEIDAEKQARRDLENQMRENARKQIEMLAERYPDLMPYQVQELP